MLSLLWRQIRSGAEKDDRDRTAFLPSGRSLLPPVPRSHAMTESHAMTDRGRHMQQPRTQQMVDWSVQGPIIGRAIFYVLGYNIMLLVLLAVVCGFQNSMAVLKDQPAQQHPSFREQAVPVVICMTCMLPFMLFDLLRLTHRIAGPLLRFEKIMGDFERGGILRQAQLRETDLLIRFQQKFNRFVGHLHQRYPETAPVKATAPAKETAPANPGRAAELSASSSGCSAAARGQQAPEQCDRRVAGSAVDVPDKVCMAASR